MKEDVVKKNENVATDSKKRISKVKVSLTLGHTASHRSKTKSDDFTHDWSFYVRGDAGCKIQHYIERVVFKLHESFNNPVQVIKKPPYEIHEQGYGTFILQVEVNFKNKREPKQIEYKYDLVLPAVGVPPIKRCRKEILTFTNPNSEFMGRLMDGGGVLHHYDTHGNLLSDPAPKPSTSEPPIKSSTPTPPANKNKEHPSASKSHKDHDERRVAKEKKRKEKKVIEEEEEQPEQEVVKDSKKQKKSSRPLSAASSNSESKVERKPRPEEKQKKKMSSVLAAIGDVESSDEEKYFKDSSPRESVKHPQQPTSGTLKKVTPKSNAQKEKSKRKKQEETFLEFDNVDALKAKKKQKTKSEKVSSPVSPEPEKKQSSSEKEEKPRPAVNSSKVQKEIKLPSKKHSSSNSDEDNMAARKVDDTFLEFDDISAIKTKKKHDKQHANVESSEKGRKKHILEDQVPISKEVKRKEKYKQLKEMKIDKPRKRSSSLSNDTEEEVEEDGEIKTPSSDVDADEVARIQNMARKVDDTFLEFDDISTIKTKKKHEKQHAKVESCEKGRKKHTLEDQVPISKEVKRKERYRQLKEMKVDKPRKRSSSLSSDTQEEVEEDGEIKTPSSDVDADEVARIQNMEPEVKEQPQDDRIQQNNKYKERKNKHKAIKKDPEKAWRPSDFEEEPADLKWLAASQIKKDFSKSSDTPKQPENSITKHSSKAPEFHRAAPLHSFPKKEIQTPPTSSQTTDILSPPLDHRQRFSESSSDQESAVKPDPYNTNEASPQQHVAAMSPDHLRFMLNIYNKINQLQKTDDKNTITEVINILSGHHDSSMDIKDDNVTFDLVNCDLETLRSIDSVLS